MARSTQRHESPRPSDASRPSDKPTSAGVSSAVQQDAATGSDTENSERPVREKLRNTTIAGINQDESDRIMSDDEEKPIREGEASNGRLSEESQRGRLQRKRSHDELEAEQQDTPLETKHSRKRSRDAGKGSSEIDRRKVSGEAPLEEADETAAAGDKPPATFRTSTPPESANGAVDESIVSPKTKRSRDEYLDDTADSVTSLKESTAATNNELASTSISQEGATQPQTKKQRDSEADDVAGEAASGAASTKVIVAHFTLLHDGEAHCLLQTSIPPTSGFANTSTSSPFGAVASSRLSDTESPAPTSAFASSGFAALSGGQTSGFGSLGASTGGASPFGAIASSKSTVDSSSALAAAPALATSASESKSPFASMSPAAGASPFATASKSSASGFGGFAGASKPASSAFGGLTGPSAFSASLSAGASAFASSSSAGAPNIIGLSNKAARPFGAPATEKEEDDEEGEGDDEGSESVKSPLHDADRPDPRFVAQDRKCHAPTYNALSRLLCTKIEREVG